MLSTDDFGSSIARENRLLLATIWPAIGSPVAGKWPPVVSLTSGPLRKGDLNLEQPLMAILEAIIGMRRREEDDGFSFGWILGY